MDNYTVTFTWGSGGASSCCGSMPASVAIGRRVGQCTWTNPSNPVSIGACCYTSGAYKAKPDNINVVMQAFETCDSSPTYPITMQVQVNWFWWAVGSDCSVDAYVPGSTFASIYFFRSTTCDVSGLTLWNTAHGAATGFPASPGACGLSIAVA